jgi:hypothetical protein
MADWEAKAKRRTAKRDQRANLYPVHGGSLRTQPPRPLSKKVRAKLRKRPAR